MKPWHVWLIGGAALLWGSAAVAQSSMTASTTASVDIEAPVGVGVVQNLSFTIPQAVAVAATSGATSAASSAAASAASTSSSAASTATSAGTTTATSNGPGGVNANILVSGGQSTSVAVPATVLVTRDGGNETMVVQTLQPVASGSGQVVGVVGGSALSQPVIVTGTMNGGLLSFTVAGGVTVRNNLAPGRYRGVLTVVAQYN